MRLPRLAPGLLAPALAAGAAPAQTASARRRRRGATGARLFLGSDRAADDDLTLVASAGGVVQRRLELGAFPPGLPHAVTSGETWRFQCWYADGFGSSLTDAVVLTLR